MKRPAIEHKRGLSRGVQALSPFTALFDVVQDGLLIANDSARYIAANAAACRLLGLPRERVLGRRVADFADPRRRGEVMNQWRVFLKRKEQHGIFRLFRPDGTSRFVDFVAKADILPGQHISILRDITERSQAERKLRDQQDHLRLALDATGLGTWEYNLLTQEMNVSDSCRTILHLSPDQPVTYQRLTKYLNLEDRLTFRAAIRECLDPGSKNCNLNAQFRFRPPESQERWMLGQGRAFFEGTGRHRKAVRFIGTVLDITQRKREETELIAARDAAESATRAKSRFLANISHEIRTPINGIVGTTELLSETPLEHEQKEYVRILRDSSSTLNDLINDLLDFSKIEAGKLKLEARDFDLYPALDAVIAQFATRLQFKDLELILRIRADVPRFLRGDLQRIRQVLTNLIGNAVKFTAKGQITVDVAIVRAKSLTLSFAVTDTGPGITAAQQARLFQPFTQGDSSVTREFGGTGLGLAISKQLTEAMGGRIGLQSRSGRGAKFWFTVPLRKYRPANRQDDGASLKGTRVMVVENNRTLRKALCEHLFRWNVSTEECVTSAQAIRKWRRTSRKLPYNVFLLSKNIPEADAAALVQAIQTIPSKSSVHIVLMGSFGQEPPRHTWKALGISAYLTKPIRYTELHQCLREFLRPSAAPAASETVLVASPRGAEAHNGSSKISSLRILLAEDNIINQIVTVRQLKKLGFSADTASNGKQVLEVLRQQPYDLILMDCQMPEMDGYRASMEIRRLEKGKRRVRIIAMTAHAMEDDRQKCLAAGMDDYIAKPVQLSALRSTLRLWGARPSSGVQRKTPIDLARLHAMTNHETEGLVRLCDLYLHETASQLRQLEMAIEKNAMAEVRQIAHSCLGASAALGMTALLPPLRRLERTKTADEHAAGKNLLRTQAEFQRVATYLKSLS